MPWSLPRPGAPPTNQTQPTESAESALFGTDPDKVAIFFKMNPIFCYGMMKDEIEEAIISDLPNAYDDALAFYDLIRTARELTSTDEPAEVLEVTL